MSGVTLHDLFNTRKSDMHTLMVTGGGIILMGAFLVLGRLWDDAAGMAVAAGIFIPVWLLAAIANLWVGVSRAGYGMREELPVLLVVFLIPAAIAALAIWHFSHS